MDGTELHLVFRREQIECLCCRLCVCGMSQQTGLHRRSDTEVASARNLSQGSRSELGENHRGKNRCMKQSVD